MRIVTVYSLHTHSQELSSVEDEPSQSDRGKSQSPSPDTVSLSLTPSTISPFKKTVTDCRIKDHRPHSLTGNTTRQSSINTTQYSSPNNPHSTTTSSSSHTTLAGVFTPTSSTLPLTSVGTSRQDSRGSTGSAKSALSSPSSVTSASGVNHQMLLAQGESGIKGAAEGNSNANNMLTLGSYVQFMTLVSQQEW